MNCIELAGVGKAYRSYPRKWGRAAEWLGAGRKHELHWVLRDVDLEVSPGESIGIIGMNGAGKSTLLKIIAGVTHATTGSVNHSGRVAALLELGMGFHPEFPGRQNVYMAGQLQGLSSQDIDRHIHEIEAFAEIGDYIDEPVRTYSSGMQVRLAFSVATAVRPDILIVDEALAVGDIYFQQKCFERISSFREQGTTLLFVSHSPGAVLQLCDRAVLLQKGSVTFDGSPKEATDLYQANILLQLDRNKEDIRIADRAVAAAPAAAPAHDSAASVGNLRTGAVSLLGAKTLDDEGREAQTLIVDTTVSLALRYVFHRAVDDPHVGFKIRNRYGVVLFETNSYCMGMQLGPKVAGQEMVATFTFPMLLSPGDYTITTGLANRGFGEGSFEEALSFLHNVHAFTVVRRAGSRVWLGVANLSPSLSIRDP